MFANRVSPPTGGVCLAYRMEPIAGRSRYDVSVCHSLAKVRASSASFTTSMISGWPSGPRTNLSMARVPNRRANALWASTSSDCSRKNRTWRSSHARRSSATVSSPSGRDRSSPETSAPIAGESGWIRKCLYSLIPIRREGAPVLCNGGRSGIPQQRPPRHPATVTPRRPTTATATASHNSDHSPLPGTASVPGSGRPVAPRVAGPPSRRAVTAPAPVSRTR